MHNLYRKCIDKGSTLTIEDSANSIKASHCYSQHCKHHHYHPRVLLAHWLATVLPYIIHQPDFEGLFSEEITSLKKLLMEGSIKEVQLPAVFALHHG